MEVEETKADVYAAGEQAWRVRTKQMRARWFGPLLRLLADCRVAPDHRTVLLLLACF